MNVKDILKFGKNAKAQKEECMDLIDRIAYEHGFEFVISWDLVPLSNQKRTQMKKIIEEAEKKVGEESNQSKK